MDFQTNIPSLIIGVAIGVIVTYILIGTIRESAIRRHRRDAVSKSRSVITGHVAEQLAPLANGFPYHPKDLVFIGKGFDYLVLDGLHEGNLQEIIFLEVKTGKSSQNRNEKMVQNTIEKKKIYYELMRM